MVQGFGYQANLAAASEAFGSAFSASAANKTTVPSTNRTLLQKVGIKVAAPQVNTAALMRDSSNPQTVLDLADVKQTAAACTQDVKGARGVAEKAHENAVGFAVALSKQVAADTPSLGIKASAVDSTYAKACATSEVVGAAAGQGLGSVVTMHIIDAAGAIGELNSENNKMGKEEAASLAAEVSCRINGQSSVHQTQNIMGVFDEPSPVDFSNADFNLAGCTGEDIQALLESNFDDCPEIVAIDQTLTALAKVDANHGDVEAGLEKEKIDPKAAVDCAHESVGALIAQAPRIEAVEFASDASEDLKALAFSREEMERMAKLSANMTAAPAPAQMSA